MVVQMMAALVVLEDLAQAVLRVTVCVFFVFVYTR